MVMHLAREPTVKAQREAWFSSILSSTKGNLRKRTIESIPPKSLGEQPSTRRTDNTHPNSSDYYYS